MLCDTSKKSCIMSHQDGPDGPSCGHEDAPESEKLLTHYSDYQPDLNQRCSCHKSSFTKWAISLCLICTVINLLLALFPVKPVSCREELASVSRNQLSQLRRPSPYIGLDKITRVPNPSPATIINYPHVIAQVDRLHQSQVFDDDPKRYLSRTGTVSPQTREVRATQSVSPMIFIDLKHSLNESVEFFKDLDSRAIPSYRLWNGNLRTQDALFCRACISTVRNFCP